MCNPNYFNDLEMPVCSFARHLLLRTATLSPAIPIHLAQDSKSLYSPLMTSLIHGRCIALEERKILVRRLNAETGLPESRTIEIENLGNAKLGDLVEVKQGQVRVLTPNRSRHTESRWTQRTLQDRRIRAIRVRSDVKSGIRDFFLNQGFLETQTPVLVPCPGMEPHIRPFSAGGAFLPTSPEFAMKRLLVGGLEKIFQICSSFRNEPYSSTHHPEFTMLEWYRAYSDYEQIMKDTEELFEFIALRLFEKPVIQFQGQSISVARPWPRLKIRDLFLKNTAVDLVQARTPELLAHECQRLGLSAREDETWDDLYFKIWLNRIEPLLPKDQAVFVVRYPRSQAALSVIDSDSDGSEWAKRFEVYAGGLELGNAFEELTDPVEQRSRFLKDMELREKTYGPDFPKTPLDEEFLQALEEGMPPSGGIALGVDRMVMLFADETEIEQTLWLRSGGNTL